MWMSADERPCSASADSQAENPAGLTSESVGEAFRQAREIRHSSNARQCETSSRTLRRLG